MSDQTKDERAPDEVEQGVGRRGLGHTGALEGRLVADERLAERELLGRVLIEVRGLLTELVRLD